MDYDLPEELQDYLPKPRQGFQLVNQRKPAPPKSIMRKAQTKAPTITVPKRTGTKLRPTANPSSNAKRTVKTINKRVPNGPTQRVRVVYPKKGKMLSKVDESKWKNVKDGPREDPNLHRTIEEEIQIFLKLTNDYRIKNKLNTLELSDDLSKIAEGHNINMMEGRTKVGHEGFKDRVQQIPKRYFQASENCAMYVGPRDHLLTMFDNLCKSPTHNANLLGTFDTIGISIGKNSENMWYVTQFFVRYNREKIFPKNDDDEVDD